MENNSQIIYTQSTRKKKLVKGQQFIDHEMLSKELLNEILAKRPDSSFEIEARRIYLVRRSSILHCEDTFLVEAESKDAALNKIVNASCSDVELIRSDDWEETAKHSCTLGIGVHFYKRSKKGVV